MLGYTTAEPVTGPMGPRESIPKSVSKRGDEICSFVAQSVGILHNGCYS